MKPRSLQVVLRQNGLEGGVEVSAWISKAVQGGAGTQALLLRLALWLFPLTLLISAGVTAGVVGALDLAGFSCSWQRVSGGVGSGVAMGVAFGVAMGVLLRSATQGVVFGVSFGVGFGMAFGVLQGVVFGPGVGVAWGVFWGLAFGVALGVVSGEDLAIPVGFALAVGAGLALGFAIESVEVVLVFVVTFFGTFLLTLFRLPVLLVEAAVMMRLNASVQRGEDPLTLCSRLPFRHDELIRVPLPRLREFLVTVGIADPALGERLVGEARCTIAQEGQAREALSLLQAHTLELVAKDRQFTRAAVRDLPFVPTSSNRIGADLEAYIECAKDLETAQTSRSHYRRREVLECARKRLADFKLCLVGDSRSVRLFRRWLRTVEVWSEVVEEELERLKRDEEANPQIPTPFQAGPSLRLRDAHLFRGRKDIVTSINHELDKNRVPPLLLVGQRRIGKSSLLNMLPVLLGTSIQVIVISFQALSGSRHRKHPHRWIEAELAAVVPDATSPPSAERWGETLAWLQGVDEQLQAKGGRPVLLAIDEVERLEDGIRAGWVDTGFLDLVRAMGDSLSRIHILLTTAHPLPRLGRHWVDRLINISLLELGYLSTEEARLLMEEPVPGFPGIYPEGGVSWLYEQTRGHPFLIQLACDKLTRHLNEVNRSKASQEDLVLAIDEAFSSNLFDELWGQRDEAERCLLQRLAKPTTQQVDPDDSTLGNLVREKYVDRTNDTLQVSIPMFASWIREHA